MAVYVKVYKLNGEPLADIEAASAGIERRQIQCWDLPGPATGEIWTLLVLKDPNERDVAVFRMDQICGYRLEQRYTPAT